MAELKASSTNKILRGVTQDDVQSVIEPSTYAVKDMSDCPVTTALEVIGGKWKVIILYQLRGQTLRFGQLRKAIPKITQKMLAQQLRELEKNKLVKRQVYPEVPPRVEYTPTELAEQLNPVLDQLCKWGSKYRAAQLEA